MVFGADAAGHLFGIGQLVVGGFGEADGERVELLSGERGGEGGDAAGVNPAAEEDADLHVAAQLVADGFVEKFPGFFGGFVEGTGAHGIVLDGQIPEIFGASAGGGPDQHLSRLHFPDPGVGRGGGRDVAESQVFVDRGGVQPRLESRVFEQGAKFRGEDQLAVVV